MDQCFKDCINDFTSETLSGGEKECIKKCTLKYMKLTNRAGIFMAEKQNLMAPTPSGGSSNTSATNSGNSASSVGGTK